MNDQPPKLELKHGPPLFEGFTLQMIKAGQQRKAKAAVTRVFSSGWQVKAFGDSGTDFEVTSKTKKRNALSGPLEVKPGDTFDEIRKINFTEPLRSSIFTVHVMGGCQMNKDDKRRCVNNDFTFKGKKNLWVVDGSIFPTALGANPQVTIYSLALWASREICEQNQKPFKLNYQQGGTLPWPGY